MQVSEWYSKSFSNVIGINLLISKTDIFLCITFWAIMLTFHQDLFSLFLLHEFFSTSTILKYRVNNFGREFIRMNKKSVNIYVITKLCNLRFDLNILIFSIVLIFLLVLLALISFCLILSIYLSIFVFSFLDVLLITDLLNLWFLRNFVLPKISMKILFWLFLVFVLYYYALQMQWYWKMNYSHSFLFSFSYQ